MEKYGKARQATDENMIQRMRFACWITKAADTHTRNNYYLLLFHGKNCYAKAPHC